MCKLIVYMFVYTCLSAVHAACSSDEVWLNSAIADFLQLRYVPTKILLARVKGRSRNLGSYNSLFFI